MVVQPQRVKPVGRTSVIGACLFVVVLVVGMEVQKHREEARAPNPPSLPVSSRTPEARLAAIQLGRVPLSEDSAVKRLASLLDLLQADCPDDPRRGLADLTVDSLRTLRSSGIATTPTEVLGGVAGLDDIGRLSRCRPYFQRYVASRRETAAANP